MKKMRFLGIIALAFAFFACDNDKETTHTHDYQWVVTTPATTEAEGVETETCTTCGQTNGTRPISRIIFTSIEGFSNWLTTKPTNTADTAYTVKLNVDDISTLKTTLNNATDKFVYLDLSDSTITTIPDNAFSTGDFPYTGCVTLTGITIPNSVTSIGTSAFRRCTSLTSITIPDSVTSIGTSAFSSCTSLTSVTIPNGVTSIGSYAFNTTSLTEIIVATGNSTYTAQDGVLYNKNKTILIIYPQGKAETSFAIPNSVTSTGEFAFYQCTSLTNVTIPVGVLSIEYSSFSYCTGLVSITIPNSVTIIGDSAFWQCTNLVSVTFEGTIASSEFSTNSSFMGDLRSKFYETDSTNGTSGTYTTTTPVTFESSVWTKQ